MPLEPKELFNDVLTNEDEHVEITSQESGGREVSFDKDTESCEMSAGIVGVIR
jgi:hypothetical protein